MTYRIVITVVPVSRTHKTTARLPASSMANPLLGNPVLRAPRVNEYPQIQKVTFIAVLAGPTRIAGAAKLAPVGTVVIALLVRCVLRGRLLAPDCMAHVDIVLLVSLKRLSSRC